MAWWQLVFAFLSRPRDRMAIEPARASVEKFHSLLTQLCPPDIGYADRHCAREVVLELRSLLNKEHKKAGGRCSTKTTCSGSWRR